MIADKIAELRALEVERDRLYRQIEEIRERSQTLLKRQTELAQDLLDWHPGDVATTGEGRTVKLLTISWRFGNTETEPVVLTGVTVVRRRKNGAWGIQPFGIWGGSLKHYEQETGGIQESGGEAPSRMTEAEYDRERQRIREQYGQ